MSDKHLPLLSAVDSKAVHIRPVGDLNADGCLIQYDTLPANNPKAYGNTLYVWQTADNVVPWDKTPVGSAPVDSDSTEGTIFLPFAFEQKGYIIGYAVAPTPKAVCATVFVPAGADKDPSKWQYANVSITTTHVGPGIAQFYWDVLDAYTPGSNKNWVGLWKSRQVPYSGADPLKKVMITSDSQDGYVTITATLTIGSTYSAGYFMVDGASGRQSLAGSTTFTVSTT